MCGDKIHNRLNPSIKLGRDLIPFHVHGHRYHDFFFLRFGFGDVNGQGGEAIVGDFQHAIVRYQHAVFVQKSEIKQECVFRTLLSIATSPSLTMLFICRVIRVRSAPKSSAISACVSQMVSFSTMKSFVV